MINGINGFEMDGGATGDQFGYSLTTGDVNGDGITDLAIGAPFRTSNTGSVYVLLGSSTLTAIPSPLSNGNFATTAQTSGSWTSNGAMAPWAGSGAGAFAAAARGSIWYSSAANGAMPSRSNSIRRYTGCQFRQPDLYRCKRHLHHFVLRHLANWRHATPVDGCTAGTGTPTNYETLKVVMDPSGSNTTIGSLTPTCAWTNYTVGSIALSAGSHTLEIIGTGGGGNTLLTNVQVSSGGVSSTVAPTFRIDRADGR